VYIF